MKPINHLNYKTIEKDLNQALQAHTSYEDWMEFIVSLIGSSEDIYQINYVLPTSTGITTEVPLAEATSLYVGIIRLVAPPQV